MTLDQSILIKVVDNGLCADHLFTFDILESEFADKIILEQIKKMREQLKMNKPAKFAGEELNLNCNHDSVSG